MAKQPKFYPNLPRVKRSKQDGKRTGNLSEAPNYCMDYSRADWKSKTSSLYIPEDIKYNFTRNIGNDIKAGTKNPGWRVTIAKGGDAGSSYNRTVHKLKSTKYTTQAENSTTICKGYGELFGALASNELDQTALNNQAIGRLRNKLNGKIGNAQLGPPLAESREIHRLVRQINGIGMKTFKSLLAIKKTQGESIFREASDIWLGFGFGVNPLLKDIQSGADSILHYVTRIDRFVTVSGTASRDYSDGSLGGSSQSLTGLSFIAFDKNSNHIQSIRYVAGVEIKVRGGSNYSVPDHLGLEVGALPSVLWELTPYSWVVDYFSTVGSFLEDQFYTLPVNVKYISKSYKYQCVTTNYPRAVPVSGATAFINGNPSIMRMNKFTRTKLAPTIPTRSLAIKSVDEIASHGLTKLLNLASVLNLKRKPGRKYTD